MVANQAVVLLLLLLQQETKQEEGSLLNKAGLCQGYLSSTHMGFMLGFVICCWVTLVMSFDFPQSQFSRLSVIP